LRDGRPWATREYFPRTFRAATRQRSRWVAGIALQGWQNHGWLGGWVQAYWFWRDRKGLLGNLLSPLANVVFLAGLSDLIMRLVTGHSWRMSAAIPAWLSHVCLLTYAIACIQAIVRAGCSARIYGWRFAAATPLRTAWGNVINSLATERAIRQFTAASLQRRGMAWCKTEHVYPRPRLGEVLVQMGIVSQNVVERAAADQPPGMRLGEYLVHLGKISEADLYRALGLLAGIPAGSVSVQEVDRLAARTLPAAAARRWQALPFRVEAGRLHVATVDIPSPALARELAGFSSLEIHYRLVRPAEFARLTRAYLPQAA
jgi:adsorption protein B